MRQVPDGLRVARYGAPDPAQPVPVTTLAWRTTGYALAIQVGLWVVVTLLAAFVDGALTADEPGDTTFAGFGMVLGFVGGLGAVGVTVIAGFSMAWLLESAVRRFAAPAHHEKVAVTVFAVAGAVVGGALVALAVRGELERPGDVDPITAGVLVWGVVAGALPAGAGRWLAARRGRERRQTAV
ncbi:hypothetical protein GCM10025864_17250 [Luteimicrobium album]|uniref:Uncharacterized protein n=1 Tax=Luteimicrobium album TaxID=1054550 RepID=A0ABQ6HZS0_9MICO|nr:hypothetical protein [Luteimicrobium album]GMA23966.1 hypothetical protein GCM10025864_17250 [Luteimicrobium album]